MSVPATGIERRVPDTGQEIRLGRRELLYFPVKIRNVGHHLPLPSAKQCLRTRQQPTVHCTGTRATHTSAKQLNSHETPPRSFLLHLLLRPGFPGGPGGGKRSQYSDFAFGKL